MKNSATIYMHDGGTRDVTRSQASRIQYILDGNETGADQSQLDFAKQVKRVVFHDVEKITTDAKPLDRKPSVTNDPKLRAIQNDPSLKGIEKLRAVMNYIKSR